MIDIVLPEIKVTKTKGNYGRYEIVPLLAGFSTSFGSGLRRVLLSSLPGAAITSVQIEGVQHEFQDIPEVREDVVDIIQNLKKVRLCSFSDRSEHIYLEVKGERTVTATDIIAPSTIAIVNPEAHIATLDNKKARLSMDMTVDVGRGFVEASAQVIESPPIGVILLDAIYSPVLHVNVTIEHVLIETGLVVRESLDKIILEITTDGTISPSEALSQSADILRQQFSVFMDYWRQDVPIERDSLLSDVPIPPYIYTMFIEELGLRPRIVNSLKRYGVRSVGHVLEKDSSDLLALRNIGEKALQEIADCLRMKGLFPK